MVKYCPKCGAEQKDHAKFCSKCGATFNVANNVTNSSIKNSTMSNSVPNNSNIKTTMPNSSNPNSSANNSSKNTLIIGITAIVLVAIICLTCLFVFTDNGSDDSSSVSTEDNSVDSVSESSSSSGSNIDSSSMTTKNFDEFSLTVPSSWSVTKNNVVESNGCIATIDTNGENVGLIFRFDGSGSNFNENVARSYFNQYSYSYINPITIGSHSGYISDAHPAGSSVNQEAFIFVDNGRIYQIVMNRNFGDITDQLVKGFVAH